MNMDTDYFESKEDDFIFSMFQEGCNHFVEMNKVIPGITTLFKDNRFMESKLKELSSKAGTAIRTLLEKVKNFIMKYLSPLLKKLGLIQDPEDNQLIINTLESIGIKTGFGSSDSKAKLEAKLTIYNPLYFKRLPGGGHAIRNWLRNIGFTLPNLDSFREKLEGYLNGTVAVGMFIDRGTDLGVDNGEGSIEDYVRKAYDVLDLCIKVQDKTLSPQANLSEVEQKKVLNTILLHSNQLNMVLGQLYRSVYVFFEPINKKTVDQFKNIEHVTRFVEDYIRASDGNYASLRRSLIKIFKYIKYKPKFGMSRIFITDSEDDRYGFKIGYNQKGVLDNKREADAWQRVQGTGMEKMLVPVVEVGEGGYIARCPKVSDVGKVSDSVIKSMAARMQGVKASGRMQDPKVGDADFTADVIIDTPFGDFMNRANVGMLDGRPVILDYANIVLSR